MKSKAAGSGIFQRNKWREVWPYTPLPKLKIPTTARTKFLDPKQYLDWVCEILFRIYILKNALNLSYFSNLWIYGDVISLCLTMVKILKLVKRIWTKCGSCLELLTNPLITFWLKRLMKTNKRNKWHELIGRGNKNNSSYNSFSRI